MVRYTLSQSASSEIWAAVRRGRRSLSLKSGLEKGLQLRCVFHLILAKPGIGGSTRRFGRAMRKSRGKLAKREGNHKAGSRLSQCRCWRGGAGARSGKIRLVDNCLCAAWCGRGEPGGRDPPAIFVASCPRRYDCEKRGVVAVPAAVRFKMNPGRSRRIHQIRAAGSFRSGRIHAAR
jgi:hypothetical protein